MGGDRIGEFTPPMVVVALIEGEEKSRANNKDEDCERGEYDKQIDLECESSFGGA